MLRPPLTDIDYIKKIFAQLDVRPDRTMGQNFLISAEIVEAALAALESGPKNVTELGPGIGSLTEALLSNNYQVKAIEKDDDFARILPTLMPKEDRSRLQLIHADLKNTDWAWQEPYQLAGNIPYNLSGLIVRQLTQLSPVPVQALLLTQKEVAQRLVAQPPEANLMSLAVSLWGRATTIANVPPSCFWPKPKVYSRLILLTPKPDNPLDAPAREEVIKLAKVFFGQRRKQLGGIAKKYFRVSADEVEKILKQCGLKAESRPQEVPTAAWVIMTELLKNKSAASN